MAWVSGDRVKETTTTTGTGDVTLAGAVSQFRAFSAVAANGDVLFYAIVGQSGTEWEVGYGTYNSGPNTITRTQVLASSNSGALVNFSAGTKDVFITIPAQQTVMPAAKNLTAESQVLPPNSTLYVAGTHEIAAGKTFEIGAGATLEVG